MDPMKLIMTANRFRNLEKWIVTSAYERGHAAGEEEVESIAMGMREEIYEAILKDLGGPNGY